MSAKKRSMRAFVVTTRRPHFSAQPADSIFSRNVRAAGRTKVAERPDGACPLLAPDQRCMAYNARPFGCRTHFCAAAGGPAARRDVLDLIRRLETVDESLGGDGPKPLSQALYEAMQPKSNPPRTKAKPRN